MAKRLNRSSILRLGLLRASVAACAVASAPVIAGELNGTVSSDTLGRPVRGVQVTVVETGQSVQTDKDGRYAMSGLEAGTYTLKIAQPGYETAEITVNVPAEGSVTADANISLSVGTGGNAILVTGARASRLQAIERKRALPVVADVVASDGIGKLPDYNTAEALQRLPGISVEIDQSEPRYVVIRGVDPNLNQVTIDGNLVGVAEAEGRRVALDTIPSALVAAIEVIKTVTPDYDANAIGGSINIITPTAFDQTDPFTFVSGLGIYNEEADQLGFGGSAMHGRKFGVNEDFGVVIGGSYSKRFIGSQLVSPINWREVAPDVISPTTVRYFDYSIERERIGAILNLDWRPDENTRVYIRNIYNEFTDVEGRDQFDYNFFRGDAVVSGNQITFDRGRASREFRQNEQTQKLYNISPGVEFSFENIDLELNYTFARAEERTPIRDDLEFRTGSQAVSTLLLDDALPSFAAVDERLFDPGFFPLRRIRLRREEIVEDLHAVRGDLTFNFTDVSDSFIKVGAKFIDRTKDRDNSQAQLEPFDDVTFADTGAVLGEIEDFYDGEYRFGPGMDYLGVLDFFDRNPGLLELQEGTTAFNELASDFRVSEQIYAGYAMASLEFDNFTAIGGVRVEHTEGTYDAFAIRDTDGNGVLEPSDIAPLSFDTSYTHVLPSALLNYRPNEQVLFRAAWTNTIGRPNYSDIVPAFEEEDGLGAAGNPDLDPFTSMGLDLSLEYYPGAESIVSVAAFYKNIDNPIFTRTIFDTSFAGVDLLSLSQPQNADSGELLGIEANVIHQFRSLPSPLDGFGVSANVAYIDSSVNVPGRDDELPFFRQSSWVVGGALFYEKGPMEARIAVDYRDEYLVGVSSSPEGDIFIGERLVVDARVAYRILDGLELFGSVANIGREPLVNFQATPDQIVGREQYGVNVDFGFSARF